MGTKFLMEQGHTANARSVGDRTEIGKARFVASVAYYIASAAIDAYRERTEVLRRAK